MAVRKRISGSSSFLVPLARCSFCCIEIQGLDFSSSAERGTTDLHHANLVAFGQIFTWCDFPRLRKVWLGQHGMRTSFDSMGGYEWSMLLLHLAQTRRVNGRMAALSIFQVALKFIADGGLSGYVSRRHEMSVFCLFATLLFEVLLLVY